MEPTAIFPPYDKRELLKQINKALSVACMTKVRMEDRSRSTVNDCPMMFSASSFFLAPQKDGCPRCPSATDQGGKRRDYHQDGHAYTYSGKRE